MLVPRLLWMLFAANTVAGTATYSGNQFIFARFPAYFTGDEYGTAHFLFIAHAREGRCTVTESNGTDYYIQLIGNNSVTPTDRVLTLGVAVEEDRAVELICTTEVSLSVLQRRVFRGIADAFPVLPVQSLSTKYIVPSVPNNALLGVVAIYNNTNVSIHLNSTCSYPFRGNTYGRGSLLSITLLQGEVLQIASSQSTSFITCDLGGTVVESSHSVAVFSGATMLCYAGCDGTMSQVPPIETWGTSFIVPPVPNMEQSRVRITSAYNGTNITIDTFSGVQSILLNEAEIYDEDFRNMNATYIKSSHPILVLQMADDSLDYRVFKAIVQTIDAYGTDYLIPDIQTSTMSYTRYVTIITSSHCTSHLNVNGTWTNQPTESQTFAITSFQPSAGFLVIKSNSSACPFGVLVTGFGNNEMYGYFSTPVRGDSGGQTTLRPGCGITNLTASVLNEYLTSPAYPKNYVNNMECEWTITTMNPSDVVRVEVLESDLESDAHCTSDYVSIYDGPSQSDKVLLTWCGNTTPSVQSTGPALTIRFRTDDQGMGQGFRLKYTQVAGQDSGKLVITDGSEEHEHYVVTHIFYLYQMASCHLKLFMII
ncbi:cubilin-like isoform X1 [Haliotis rufescens]|uniref:cubilin-like isoform X1 n=1 Tax=Haliotis rufescens TaxID=6454 RepID=UPI00201F3761|nr:cubilin-like isoform X1 [Haliotis rufescens]